VVVPGKMVVATGGKVVAIPGVVATPTPVLDSLGMPGVEDAVDICMHHVIAIKIQKTEMCGKACSALQCCCLANANETQLMIAVVPSSHYERS